MEDQKLATAKDGIEENSSVEFAEASIAKWLGMIELDQPKPSPELTGFLSKCDASTDSVRRANIILQAILTAFGLDNQIEWVRKRKNVALKLYYRVLLSICIAEREKLSNLSSLLSNERFQRSMLACSAELILAAHNTETILFITIVLERAGITGFDLCKMIENFVRYEKCLPKKLRRHLNSLEERLLEKVVWEKGSSLYNSLAVAKPTLSGEIQRLWLFADPMPLLDSIASIMGTPSPSSYATSSSPSNDNDLSTDGRKRKRLCTEYRGVLVERNSFTSPIKHQLTPNKNLKKLPQQALQFPLASELSPTRSNSRTGRESSAKIEIDMFLGKVLKLAAVRIKEMVDRLKLPEEMRENIYRLFNLTLSKRTSLFFNRHLDHIILCCFFMAAKMVQQNLTFREIIVTYMKQQRYRDDVYRRVYVERSADRYSGNTRHEHVSIDIFYNEIFLLAIKPLLVEFSPMKTEDIPLQGLIQTPTKSPFSNLPDHSPTKISAKHNVYVSPLRLSKMEAFISISSNSSYAFVGESTDKFQSPSKDLKAINDRLNRRTPKVKLNFDDKDHGVLITDSTVVGSLFGGET